VDRKGGRESYYLPHPFVGVIGGIPPAMLGSLSEEQGRDDGFTDRILFVYPSPDDFPRQRWSKAELSEAAEQDWAGAITRLHAMPMVVDDPPSPEPDTSSESSASTRPYYVRLTPEAEREWGEWFDGHSDEMAGPGFAEDLAGSWSKMKAHVARFALILSRLALACDPTADPQTGPVAVDHVRGAIALANYFKVHTERVRHEMTGGVGSMDAKLVLDWVRRNRKTEFREADVSADLRRFRTNPRALSTALLALVLACVIRPKQEARHAGPGRTGTTLYEVNPAVHEAPGNTENTANGPEPGADPPISGNCGNSRRTNDEPTDGRETVGDGGDGVSPSPDGDREEGEI
jgi:hypothetical protein